VETPVKPALLDKAAAADKEHKADKADKVPTLADADHDAAPRKAAAQKKSEPVKAARKERGKDKDKDKDKDRERARDKERKTAIAAAPKKKPVARAEPKIDNDVALLAALLAHSKASAAPRVSKTASEYKRCGTLGSVADADKCREKLCEGSAKARSECKTLRVAKASG
jgi:hypothetical protein